MLSLFAEYILPFFIVIPGAIGLILSLPILLFYPLFMRFRLRPSIRHGIAVSVGLISTLIVMSLYTRSLISLNYALSIQDSPDGEILLNYSYEVIKEAWWHAVIPPPYQKSCYSSQEIVCQLAGRFPLGIWDWRIDSDDLPWLSGGISGITSAIMVWAMFRSIMQRANSTSVVSAP